jgi:hypothetical protein
MNDNKKIEIIKNQISKLDDENFDLNSWVMATDNFIKNIWGSSTPKSNQLYAVCNTMSASMFGYSAKDVITFKSQWKSLLESYIIELENLENPTILTKPAMNNINLTVNQNQSQEQIQKQSVKFELIVEILKENLTGKQIKELDSIIKQPESSEKATKLTEKLLSFGSNVAAGILGNILSNPQITGLL